MLFRSVTTIQAGDAYNVIPQTAVIHGTFRTFSNDTMKQIEDCMRRIATGVAAAFGATAKVDLPDMWAQLVNDPVETQFIADVAADLVGEAHVDRTRSLIMGSEDFAYMLEACPGAFINALAIPTGLFTARLQRRGIADWGDSFCAAGGEEIATCLASRRAGSRTFLTM